VPLITVPKALRDRLGEDRADALVALINAASDQNKTDVLAFVDEKFERRLPEEVARLRVDLSAARAGLLRWMSVFWVGQLAAVLGVVPALLQRYRVPVPGTRSRYGFQVLGHANRDRYQARSWGPHSAPT
jgi:hypothetical protein